MEQLTVSKQRIENEVGAPCRHLCYPSGDWNDAVARIARNCEYQSAVTTRHGFARLGDQLFSLCRMNFLDTPDTNVLLFRASGFPSL